MLGNALVKTFSITLSLPRACENSAHIVFDKQHNYVIQAWDAKVFWLLNSAKFLIVHPLQNPNIQTYTVVHPLFFVLF